MHEATQWIILMVVVVAIVDIAGLVGLAVIVGLVGLAVDIIIVRYICYVICGILIGLNFELAVIAPDTNNDTGITPNVSVMMFCFFWPILVGMILWGIIKGYAKWGFYPKWPFNHKERPDYTWGE